MQSINAGFQSLKTLIPHTDGEKLSKVSRVHTLVLHVKEPKVELGVFGC